MKKLYTLFGLTLFFSNTYSQDLTVGPATDLYISPGTAFSVRGIAFTPDAAFTLNDISLSRNSTTAHPVANGHISRVYLFTGNTPAFTGSIQIQYSDAELNGIPEPSLRLNIHNGASWQMLGNNVNDEVANYVLTSSVNSHVLNELTLGHALFPLPLQWGSVTAYRNGTNINIQWTTEQEQGVTHFDVERSTDASNWTVVIAGVPARNAMQTAHYLRTDSLPLPQQSFYRIKQTDIDGQFTYSHIVVVQEENRTQQVVVYPNPASTYFTMTGIDPALIKETKLYNADGSLIKSWNGRQVRYELPSLAKGVYYIHIHLVQGAVSPQKIIVQ